MMFSMDGVHETMLLGPFPVDEQEGKQGGLWEMSLGRPRNSLAWPHWRALQWNRPAELSPVRLDGQAFGCPHGSAAGCGLPGKVMTLGPAAL